MKLFNLQEALAGKPVVTRDGRPVQQIIYVDKATNTEFRVVAVVYGDVQRVRENGQYWEGDAGSKYDLFMATEKKEGWVNILRGNIEPYVGSAIFETKENAEEVGGKMYHYITSIKIEWEE